MQDKIGIFTIVLIPLSLFREECLSLLCKMEMSFLRAAVAKLFWKMLGRARKLGHIHRAGPPFRVQAAEG